MPSIRQLRKKAFETLEDKLKNEICVRVIEIGKDQKIQREGIIKKYHLNKNSGKVSILTDGYFSDEGYHSGNILEKADIEDIDQELKQQEEIQTSRILSDAKSIEIYASSEIKVEEQNTETKKEIKDMLENLYLLKDRCNNPLDSHAPFEMTDLLEQADEMHLEECPWTFEICGMDINVSDYISELKKKYSAED